MTNYDSLVRVSLLAAFILMLQISWGICTLAAAALEEHTIYLKSLRITGNNLVSTKVLKKELAMTLPSFWPWKKLPPFKEGELERDLGRLKAYYRQQGFFHTRIKPRLQKLAKQQVAVELQIAEGPWIKVTQINLQVAATERALDLRQLEEKRPLKIGERLIAGNYEDLKRLYLDYLLNNGYPHAVVAGKV
jgi:outer membrane protein assembly factor BamA